MTMTLKYGTFPDIVNSPSNAVWSMDATGERWASIFQIATAGNIAKIHAYAAGIICGYSQNIHADCRYGNRASLWHDLGNGNRE
jgi:hypothetical protein